MIEQIVSCTSALVLIAAAAMRLNILKASRAHTTIWQVLEAAGLVVAMAGLAGIVGEWFVHSLDEMRSETIFVAGAAIFAVGISRGRLCQVVARLQGWDGKDRRARASIFDGRWSR